MLRTVLCLTFVVAATGCNLFTSVADPQSHDAEHDAPSAVPDGGARPDTASTGDSGPDGTVDAAVDSGIPLTCGDGELDEGEECDDGERNTDEPGGFCRTNCKLHRCGDGILDPGRDEECDDGNFRSHDGCSSACLNERAEWTRVDAPLARSNHAMAFDEVRGVLVLFGGRDHEGRLLNDTWEYDGTSWSLKSPADAPSHRYDHKMVYDPDNHKVVLFGGKLPSGDKNAETWLWDGLDWERQATTSSPPPTSDHAVVWSDFARSVLMFGGKTDTDVTAEIWKLDRGGWSPLTPLLPIPAREEHAMAAIGSTILVHGGRDTSKLDDTWEFDLLTGVAQEVSSAGDPRLDEHQMGVVKGVPYIFGGDDDAEVALGTYEFVSGSWRSVPEPDFAPAPRISFAMVAAYDQDLYLFGGKRGDEVLGDLWSYDGADWTLHSTQQLLSIDDAASAYDIERGVLTVFGGDDAQSDRSFGTWSMDGVSLDWTYTRPVPSPTHYGGQMAYDEKRGVSLYFGGLSGVGGQSDQLWEYDNGSWRQLPELNPRPAARNKPHVLYSSNDEKVLVVGGCSGGEVLSDVWTFDGESWQRLVNSGPFTSCVSSAAYDRARGRIVVLSPENGRGETFEFDGRAWNAHGAVGPPPRTEAQMVYHPTLERVVLFGGRDISFRGKLQDTLEWDGTSWRPIDTDVVPPARSGASLTWNPALSALVLAGGNGAGNYHLNDTWLYHYVSATPDEACGTVADADGDGLAGCDDPDCAQHPLCP